jgi:hypothetical protein
VNQVLEARDGDGAVEEGEHNMVEGTGDEKKVNRWRRSKEERVDTGKNEGEREDKGVDLRRRRGPS